MNRKLWLACGVVAVGAVALGLVRRSGESVASGGDAPKVLSHVTYQRLTFEQLATGAQGVYAGRIVSVSPTLWNQDGGAYWEETIVDAEGLETINTAIPYYEIAMDVDRPIVDDTAAVGPGGSGRVVVTVVGMSPADEMDAAREAIDAAAGNPHDHLFAGQSAVLFARQTQMTWRDGTRTVLQAMGSPEQSVMPITTSGSLDAEAAFEAGTDSVGALVDRILALRAGEQTE